MGDAVSTRIQRTRDLLNGLTGTTDPLRRVQEENAKLRVIIKRASEILVPSSECQCVDCSNKIKRLVKELWMCSECRYAGAPITAGGRFHGQVMCPVCKDGDRDLGRVIGLVMVELMKGTTIRIDEMEEEHE